MYVVCIVEVDIYALCVSAYSLLDMGKERDSEECGC